MTAYDMSFEEQLQRALDSKTKPKGSLGRVEDIAAQIARIQNTLNPRVDRCSLTIFAGDHGMAKAGVSAFPQSVTRQMVLNFLQGGAAANVFARQLDVTLQVVDAGVAGPPVGSPNLIDRRLGPGTDNAIQGPAMSQSQLEKALELGHLLGANEPFDAVCFGEMGIGNSSSASLIAAKVLGLPVRDLIGPGTGLNEQGLAHKNELLGVAAARTGRQLDITTALQEYGGFEIAMMAGAMTGAAEQHRVVIVDGFIATVAALCASKLQPLIAQNMIYAHRSAEPGHGIILKALDATPLLDLDMRLGEGTGALLAWPLIKTAAAMLSDMTSFDDASVSGPT